MSCLKSRKMGVFALCSICNVTLLIKLKFINSFLHVRLLCVCERSLIDFIIQIVMCTQCTYGIQIHNNIDKDFHSFLFLLQLLFLQDDRYVEFHTQYGRHYRTRIPKYGRDLSYHPPSCEVYFVGVS